MLNIYATYFLVAFSIARADVFQEMSTNEIHISKYNGSLSVDKLNNFDQVRIKHSTIKIDLPHAQLKILTIVNSNLGEVSSGIFQAFPNLIKLELKYENKYPDTYTRINDFKLEDLNTLTKLEYLTIECMRVGKMEAKALNKLQNLKELSLTYMGIESLDGEALIGLDNLEVLDLSSNSLKTIERKTLEPVKKLRQLVLDQNAIGKFGPENIPFLPELKFLDLGQNPVPMDDVDRDAIKKLAPNAIVRQEEVGSASYEDP